MWYYCITAITDWFTSIVTIGAIRPSDLQTWTQSAVTIETRSGRFGYAGFSQLVSDRSVQTFNDSLISSANNCSPRLESRDWGQPFFKCQSSSFYFLRVSVERIHWKTISRTIKCQIFATKLAKGVLRPNGRALTHTDTLRRRQPIRHWMRLTVSDAIDVSDAGNACVRISSLITHILQSIAGTDKCSGVELSGTDHSRHWDLWYTSTVVY